MTTAYNVGGTAVRAGISRNGIKYLPEELKKFSKTLAGRPILKDHISRTDNAMGLVTKSSFLDGEASVPYRGWIKDDATREKIEDKRIKEVSIGAIAGQLVREKEGSDIMIAKDLVALELSTTPTPGVVGTSISQSWFFMDEAKEV